MKTNLSSQIKLDRIPKRYYAPDGELELAALTRDEKVYTKIFEGSEEGSVYVAHDVAELIQKCKAEHRHCVLALGSGVGTHAVYAELVRMYQAGEVSFSNVIVFNIGEYYPLAEGAPGTMSLLKELLLDKVNIDPAKINLPDGTNPDAEDACAKYNQIIHAVGGIDLQLLGIGHDGHIGFNEPGEAFELETHCVNLTPATIEANKRFFDGNVDLVPKQAYTMGIRTIMQARKVLMVVNGVGKAEIVKKAFFGPVTPEVPASILQLHPDFILVADEEALSLI